MSKIFIVEDEEAIAELERDYLELSGFEVEVSNDGNAGLKKALEEDFDLLILDLMLPGKCGTQRTCRSSWFPQKRMISIKSVDLALGRTTI